VSVAFKIIEGRGIAQAISVQDRFRIVHVAAITDESNLGGVPIDLAGHTMGDNYLEVLDYVDSGVALYRGTRAKDKCLVTVKVFSLVGHLGDDHKALADRIEASPKLKHPNIEMIYEAGRKGDLFFVAGERLDGESLAEKIERDGALPPQLANKILTTALTALTALHNRNHFHGDVCPETLFLARDGTLKITGINQTRPSGEQLVLGGELLGNADYLAPERIDGRSQDPASDLYSLGHTFYYLLAGRAPFAGNSPIGTMICHLNQEPPELQRMSDGITEDSVKIFTKLTGKTFEIRYKDAQQALTDLKMAVDGRGTRIEAFNKVDEIDKVIKVVQTSLMGVLVVFIILGLVYISSALIFAVNRLSNPVDNISVPILPVDNK
jgi:serine/threonine protein kinase